MPASSLPVESRSRRRPSGAGFRRTATQMALSRCAIAHQGADWYFWRGTPAIACVAAQPSCRWHLPEAGQAVGGPCPALEAKWLHRHPVAPRNHDSDQARASSRRSGRFGRGDVLRSRPLVTGGSVATSHRAQPLPICRAGGSRDPGEVVAAGLVTLVPAARDQRLRNRRTAALT